MGSASKAGVEPAMLEDVIELGEEHIDGGDEYMHLGSNSGSSSESDVSFYEDSEYEQSDDDGLYEANIDEAAEWGGFHNRKEKQPVELELGEGLDDYDDLGDVSSDELQSVHSNSDEDGKTRYPEYRRETDLGKVMFKTGMLFCTAKEFREAVREYAIKQGKDIKFVKNETTRVRAICAAKSCPWYILGSLTQKGEAFQVKSFESEHKCVRAFNIRHANSKWLASKYVDSIRSNPNMPLEHLQDRIKADFIVNVSRSQAYRTKRKAIEMIEGTYLEQYGKLWDYCAKIRRSNPNTTIIMKTIPPPTEDGQPTFERLYICLGALKQGMLAGCRRFICMDACQEGRKRKN
ncbi:hypothetical protein Vadar_010817 [Vaccinium darrowii]|uniref:Uncharacterized protein n=1 Tax=Vaccinium darrowii TaxID=229202 RepID=A0ACB7XPX1_9ERIC|nr:hypothetical protein Vadar_010817 [Vaccinium darrowii]